jgi:two-component system NtrC family sensor kinase
VAEARDLAVKTMARIEVGPAELPRLVELREKVAQSEKLAALGQFVAGIAHELNNPLEGILTFAKLLMKRIGKSGLPEDEIKRTQKS